jgi:hypothetical protein
MEKGDITSLSSPEIQTFIFENERIDINRLLLKSKTIFNLSSSMVAQQIGARIKAKEKLPLHYQTRGIIYPPGLNLEQSSSETTARFKQEIILNNGIGLRKVADLTGGFGVDSYWLSQIFEHVVHVEPNGELIQLAEHNHQTLGATNLSYQNISAEQYLEASTYHVDLYYVDPSRRTDQNKKLFLLNETMPNVLEIVPKLFEFSPHVLIKMSPLLDIQSVLNQNLSVSQVYVVAVGNECKEVLVLCSHSYSGEPTIHAVNINRATDEFTFQFPEERAAESKLGPILSYLYEPNAAILKSGAFKIVGNRFGLTKVHPNSHYYTSDQLLDTFPGRIFSILKKIKGDRSEIKGLFPDFQANVISRNHPLSVDEIKRKLRLSDGGNLYLIATTDMGGRGFFQAVRIG